MDISKNEEKVIKSIAWYAEDLYDYHINDIDIDYHAVSFCSSEQKKAVEIIFNTYMVNSDSYRNISKITWINMIERCIDIFELDTFLNGAKKWKKRVIFIRKKKEKKESEKSDE